MIVESLHTYNYTPRSHGDAREGRKTHMDSCCTGERWLCPAPLARSYPQISQCRHNSACRLLQVVSSPAPHAALGPVPNALLVSSKYLPNRLDANSGGTRLMHAARIDICVCTTARAAHIVRMDGPKPQIRGSPKPTSFRFLGC